MDNAYVILIDLKPILKDDGIIKLHSPSEVEASKKENSNSLVNVMSIENDPTRSHLW